MIDIDPEFAEFIDVGALPKAPKRTAKQRADEEKAEAHIQTGKPPRGQSASYKRLLDIKRDRYARDLQVSTENVLQELARIAFYDIRNLFDENGIPLAPHDLSDDTAAAVANAEVVYGGEEVGGQTTVKYRMGDKLKALDALAKRLNLFEEHNRQEVSITSLTKKERARRVAFLLTQAMRNTE